MRKKAQSPQCAGATALFWLRRLFAGLWYHAHTDTSQLHPATEARRETLVALLRERGVRYLAPSDAVATEEIGSDEALLLALLQQSDARLRLALIPLLLRQPQLAENVATLVNELGPEMALDLQTLYMVALYLQRLWWTRLGFYLGIMPLPDLFSQQINLPPADERHGKNGLRERSPMLGATDKSTFFTLICTARR